MKPAWDARRSPVWLEPRKKGQRKLEMQEECHPYPLGSGESGESEVFEKLTSAAVRNLH